MTFEDFYINKNKVDKFEKTRNKLINFKNMLTQINSTENIPFNIQSIYKVRGEDYGTKIKSSDLSEECVKQIKSLIDIDLKSQIINLRKELEEI